MKLFFLITILLSCASGPKRLEQLSEASWVKENPCMKNGKICALGYGKTQSVSDLRAKKELAAYFKSKITSDLNNQQLSKQTLKTQESYERTSIMMKEFVEDYIESVYIEKRAQSNEMYYSLANIDKKNLNARLDQRYQKFKSEIKVLEGFPFRTSLKRLKAIFNQKAQLDSIYSSLNSRIKLAGHSYTQYQNLYETKKIYLQIENSLDTAALRSLSEKLRRVGHTIVKDKKKADVIVKANLLMKSAHLNVTGFKKYKVKVQIESEHVSDETQGEIQFSEFVTGRSKEDARIKALSLIDHEINKKFYLLKI